jgi:ferredoxin-NADP reductase
MEDVMSGSNIVAQLDGYEEIQNEIEVLRKYAPDRRAEKGAVARIVDRLHPKTLNLRVSEIYRETDSTKTLRMVSDDGRPLPPFQAGQYINLFVSVGGVRTSRPYSISSPPNRTAYYDITVREVAQGFVSSFLLEDTRVGDRFQATSPAGQFHHNPLFHCNDLVFIAGGSGITPFMSMIREVTDRGLERNIHLIYGSRSQGDIIFEPALSEISGRHPNVSTDFVISEPPAGYSGPSGFVTAELIQGLAGDPAGKMFYVCGPEVMYTFVLGELEKLGIPRRRVRVEVFGPPSEVTAQPGWPEGVGANDVFDVSLTDGQTIKARAGEPLMNSLERTGIVLPASCRSGACSLCRTRLISGNIFHPPGVQLRKSDRQYGYIHPCMAYPLSDLELLLRS